jgi:hypothetical protein
MDAGFIRIVGYLMYYSNLLKIFCTLNFITAPLLL